MLLNTEHARLNLHRDELARLVQACGTRVDCVDGVAWITMDGDRRDIVLTRGQSHLIESNADVIIFAIHGAAALEIHADAETTPCARARPARSAGLLQGLLGLISPNQPVAA